MLSDILASVILFVLLVIVVVIVIGLKTWIKKNNYYFLQDNMMTIEDIVMDVVVSTNNTYVNALKEKGEFDVEAQKEAFNKTLTDIKAIIGDRYMDVINDAYEDIDTFLKVLIEKCVSKAKEV